MRYVLSRLIAACACGALLGWAFAAFDHHRLVWLSQTPAADAIASLRKTHSASSTHPVFHYAFAVVSVCLLVTCVELVAWLLRLPFRRRHVAA
jgi:hypothetical protein